MPAPPAPAVIPSTSTASGSVSSSNSGSHLPRQVALLPGIGFPQVSQTFQSIAQTNTASGSVPSPDNNSHLLRQVAFAPQHRFSSGKLDLSKTKLKPWPFRTIWMLPFRTVLQGHLFPAQISHYHGYWPWWFSYTRPAYRLPPASATTSHHHCRPSWSSSALCNGKFNFWRVWQSWNNKSFCSGNFGHLQHAGSSPRHQTMITDMTAMAKVIPNVPLKLQHWIIHGMFIDLSELLLADFSIQICLSGG